ncbi:MAG: zinc metalloprotease HtpX [Armatimonadota bacterium]
MNTLKTGVLLVGMTVLFMLLGRWIGGQSGMIVAFAIAMVMNVVSYWFSDKIVLRMYHAQPVTENDSTGLYAVVSKLAQNAGIPMPKLYIIPGNVANAFATGRDPNHAAVAVTEGLMQILDKDEVAGVIAHELAHVKNRDILISTIAATIAGAIMIIADIARWGMIFGGFSRSDDDEGGGGIFGTLIAIIVAPIAAMLIQMAISRSREYQADATGSEISGKPLDLADALLKLESTSQSTPSYANGQTAHMFIINPLKGGISGLFSTHPPISERVSKLRDIASGMGQR